MNLKRTFLMGVVNCTPDSFFDGGKHGDPRQAIDHALRLVAEGADIIDIGGESTRPGAAPVSLDDELNRVLPVIRGVRKQSSVAISIDTQKSRVAAEALEAGATMINDISAGRFDPEMLPWAAHTNVPICLMHMRGDPQTMQQDVVYQDLVGEVRAFLADAINRAVACGVKREQIVLDPGIGFGKSAEGNVTLLHHLDVLTQLGCPVLVGSSRKSFIGKLLDLPLEQRLEPTLATLAVAKRNGATMFRVHDVGPARRFLDMLDVMEKVT